MKFLLPFETAAHSVRDKLFAHLLSYEWFRKVSLLTTKEDILLVTKQFEDHQLTFSPHETIGRDLFRKGHYQRDLASWVLEQIGKPAGKTLLEVGANIGTHSVYLMLSGKFERAICIEPDPRNFRLLKHNLELNGFSSAATLFECAAGDRDGSIDLYFGNDNFGSSTVIKPIENSRSVNVRLRRIDAIMAEAGATPDDIGLVWMDIEGSEPQALRSMPEVLRRGVPILMEYSPPRYGPAKTKELAGYLSGLYRRCYVFGEGETDIRSVTEGRDVLLLP